MIVTKCPVRIGLVGGSSDLDSFMNRHGRGAVINFPVNIYTYVITHTDIVGHNAYYDKYIVNYSSKEVVDKIENIKNILVKTAFTEFDVPPCYISMTSDVFSVGSGLASSSSYMVSLLKSISSMNNLNLSNYELSTLAMKLERKFNPLLGFQDTYGCGIGKLKRIDCTFKNSPQIKYLPDNIFNSFDMYVVYSGISRNSTNILKTINITDDTSMLCLVDEMQECIEKNDREKFIKLISSGWEIKKKTSKQITSNEKIRKIDNLFENDDDILCHKLCGAGNGGFFLLFTEPNKNIKDRYDLYYRKIKIDKNGVESHKI